MKKTRLLFVCMGNICRSPAAEGVMNHLIQEENLERQIECDSAGTIHFHAGNPPDRRMRAAAENRGIRLTSRARQITRNDLDDFDLILTMDEDNFAYVTALDPTSEHRSKIKRFCSYCTAHTDTEVPDPYYGGDAGFEHVLDMLEDGCAHLLQELRACGT